MIDCEIGHVYADLLVVEDLEKSIKTFKSSDLFNKSYSATLLIDDYNVKNPIDDLELKIKKEFYKHGLEVDCYYESEMIYQVDIIFDFFKDYIKQEFFKKQQKWVYFLCIENKKIKLKEIYDNGQVKYSCICLSVIWHLKRKYAMKDIDLNSKGKNIEIYSVLSYEYKEIEVKVELILNFMGFNINYIFY